MVNSLVTLLVGLLHIVLADGLSQQGCGMGALPFRARVFGGKQSSPGMWPWQVGIHKQSSSDDSRYDIICGGALIDPQWVVTAAHCFYVKRTSSSRIWFEADITPLVKYKIIAGDINTQIIEPSQQERYATEVYIHPGYRHSPYYENDIALVKLNQTVTTSRLVGTVCLPGTNIDLAKPGTVGTVAGWGRSAKSLRSTLLIHTSILIKTNAVCKQATRYYVNKTVTFCAGDDNGRNDTCQGDSGGSLVRRVMFKGQKRWVTVGLVSWGEGCGLAGKYGYYTRMHPFVTWIKDTVNSSRFSCSHPGDIPFGKLINDNRNTRFPVDIRVKYRCVVGYIPKGKSGRKCKDGGKWTKPPVCVKERHCPYVRAPRNGVRRPSKRRYSYKEKIRFHCVRNSVMVGRSSLTCKIDGRWNGYPPLCLAPCQDPGIPKDGVRLGDNFKHGQTVRFICKKKPMTGTPSIICYNGVWNSDAPTCGKAHCKDPGKPKGGRRLQHSFLHGDKVSFSCNKGWKMDGVATITCNDEKWDHKAPKCLAHCKDPGIPKGGRRLQDSFLHGDKVSFLCNKGWKMDGVATITCNDGKWDHKAPKCLEGCLKPRHSSDGFVSPSKHFYNDGEEVKMYCNWSYVRVGDSSSRCSNGRWSKDPPSCHSKCRNPGSPHDGWADGSEYYEGKQVHFRCKNGYDVIGPLVIQCLDTGRWSGPVPQCKKRCSYHSPANSKPYSNTPIGASLKHGTTINHNCIKDYTLVGQKSITCNDGSWQPSIPSCKANCRNPGIPSNGQRNGSSFNHLDVVKFSCDKTFVMVGVSVVQCFDGKWSTNPPDCTDCVMVGSRVLGRWSPNYNGGYVYYRAYVRTISTYTVQLELEDKTHHDNYFKIVAKTDLVLDVPNKQFNLPKGTRVLVQYKARYYTATIDSTSHPDYYRVDPDSSWLKTNLRTTWIRKKDIRVLKQEQFCASN